jgi:hypothetical protein
MSATEVIKELEELPSHERQKVLRWLQQQGLEDLWPRADAIMKNAPKLNEGEILKLPRVRPPQLHCRRNEVVSRSLPLGSTATIAALP